MLHTIVFLSILCKVCHAIGYTVIWIIQVTITVRWIIGVRNSCRCTFLISFNRMTVDSSDLADVWYLCSSSTDVFCRQSWWQRRSFWQLKCSPSFMLREWPEWFDNHFRVRNVSYGCQLAYFEREVPSVSHVDFGCPATSPSSCRPWPILCKFISSASCFISKQFSVFLVSNTGSSHAKIPLLTRANYLTTPVSWHVSHVVFDCLQQIPSRPREKLASTLTLCGIIENMSRATFKRSAYFECVSSGWYHLSVISGIENVLLISIESE